jgi:RepB DNA-primase from phage plasmid
MNLEEAEGLLHAMAHEFGGDPAATDATRVLRVPGLANKKYDTDFYVQASRESTETYHLRDFKLHIDPQESPRHNYNNRANREPSPRSNLSQSEHDWAFAKTCPRAWRRSRSGHPANCPVPQLTNQTRKITRGSRSRRLRLKRKPRGRNQFPIVRPTILPQKIRDGRFSYRA